MFVARSCAENGCNRPALTGATTCVVHTASPEDHVRQLIRPVNGRIVLEDADLAGVRIEDADLSGAVISGCRLTAATFVRVTLKGCQIQLSFLDRATFEDCDFSGAAIQNTVFGGSRLLGCVFEDCEIVQANFLGIEGERLRFDHSNLYGSRFIGAVLSSVSMRDCNLTRAAFDLMHRDLIDYRSSNTAEAQFQEPPE